MAVLRIRLCDSDRDQYGGPEWLELDRDVLEDTPADELYELERQMGFSLEQLLDEIPTRSARTKKAVAWLARHQAGLDTLPWDQFQPRVMRAEFATAAGGEAVPPDQTPSQPGPEDGGSEDSSADAPSDTP